MGTLHLSKLCRDVIPTIPVVTRQARNVGQISVRARHWMRTAQDPGQSPPGCTVLHQKNCVACKKIVETNKFHNPVTGFIYTIRRRYNCKSSWIIYLARCKSHNMRYWAPLWPQARLPVWCGWARPALPQPAWGLHG